MKRKLYFKSLNVGLKQPQPTPLKQVLGERAHKAIKEIESQVAGLLVRKRTKLAEKFLKRIDELW